MLTYQTKKGDIMDKDHKCSKCNSDNFYVLKEEFNGFVGWFIPLSTWITKSSTRADITAYICDNCGYIEFYLDDNELQKIRNYKNK